MNYKDNIGVYAYIILDGKIERIRIEAGRETVHLNTGSDGLGIKIEYQVYLDVYVWLESSLFYFKKEDIIKDLL